MTEAEAYVAGWNAVMGGADPRYVDTRRRTARHRSRSVMATDQKRLSATIIAQRIAYEDDDEWTETETSYGAGGYRINRKKLSELIEAAIEAERRN